jgi:hypothetical protein
MIHVPKSAQCQPWTMDMNEHGQYSLSVHSMTILKFLFSFICSVHIRIGVRSMEMETFMSIISMETFIQIRSVRRQ